jgi:hypothetical protein
MWSAFGATGMALSQANGVIFTDASNTSSCSSLAICSVEMPARTASIARRRAQARPAIAARSIMPTAGRMIFAARSSATTAAVIGYPRSVFQPAALVGAKKLPPVVSASSATIAFYGSSAPIDRPNASEMIAPEAAWGRSSFTIGGIVCRAPTASHSISKTAI